MTWVRLTPPSRCMSPTRAASGCTSQGSTLLYEPCGFPHRLIGPVRFLWQPCRRGQRSASARLLLWVHPSTLACVVAHLRTCHDTGAAR